MSDAQIIELIAQTWVDNGGDEEGIYYCWQRIANRVKEIKEEQETCNS